MATLYDEIILDHIKNARNYKVPEGTRLEISGSNVLCGDEIVLYLVMNAGRVQDIGFQCSCCGISMASASIMTEMIKGKNTGDAEALLQAFLNMVHGAHHTNGTALNREQQAIMDTVQRFPARAACAALPWTALMTAFRDPGNAITC